MSVGSCWECGRQATGAIVSKPASGAGSPWKESKVGWLWCNGCGAPAVQTEDEDILPAARFGPHVGGLPDKVEAAYTEARDCMGTNAHTGAELLCRWAASLPCSRTS